MMPRQPPFRYTPASTFHLKPLFRVDGETLKTAALVCGVVIIPIQIYYAISIDRHFYEDFRDFEKLFEKYVVPSTAWLVALYFDITLIVMAVTLILSILQDIAIGLPLFLVVHLICYFHHVIHWVMFLYGWHQKTLEQHSWEDYQSEQSTLSYINGMLILWLVINLVFLSVISSYFISMNE